MRVKATTVESFRLLCSASAPWMTEDRFLAQLRGEVAPTEEMLLGRAVHACIEAPDRYRQPDGSYFAEDRALPADLVEACLAAVPSGGVREVRGEKAYTVRGGEVTVSCIADLLLGNAIFEHKTRWRPWEPKDYADSLQWRIYADVFWGASVTYTAFQLARTEEGGIRLVDTNTLCLYPYPDMRAEVASWVERLVEYVDERGLRALFPDRRRAA